MPSQKDFAIHWFRQDLRLYDNPALTAACQHANILPIYILDNENAGDYALGGASRWWLHHSLYALNNSLNGGLSIYQGNPLDILQDLIQRYDITAIYWNRCYEPWRIERDTTLKSTLQTQHINIQSFNASLLWEPWEIKKKEGTHYKVFTPFYRKGCLNNSAPRHPIPAPQIVHGGKDMDSLNISQLELLDPITWHHSLEMSWTVGEDGAQKCLKKFLNSGLDNYKEGRNIPSKPHVSRLSPHLHFGEISINQLWYEVQKIGEDNNVDTFCSELGWREFSYSQLYHYPDLPKKNLQSKFNHFPWVYDEQHLHAWQKGQTGIPIIDAGMRELWQTGYMHNRVRMIVGSFLVKNLRIHWHHGERWFWDCLVDADLASNSASWQWIAGCGDDAAPYFRIFNPVIQGQKFDAEGSYTTHYVPELKRLPKKHLFNPWEAPANILHEAGVFLGENYPQPIVSLKQSRESALEAFSTLKSLA